MSTAINTTTTQTDPTMENQKIDETTLAADQERLANLQLFLREVLLGKEEQIDLVIACILAQGHLLLDDLPGTGKTTLAKAIADAVGGQLSRVQCTPDLMPAEITGFSMFNQKTREFDFQPGPVFSDVLLADELNRTTPRTQSALLEAMAERQVSIEGKTHPLSPSFFVIATQNPIDSHGAYPVPEAQLDRFAIKLKIGYPDRQAQQEILKRAASAGDPSSRPSAAMNLQQLQALQERTRTLFVHDNVRDFLIDLVEATRDHPAIELGTSPRGMLAWQSVAQGWAILKNRDYVTPTDVLDVADAVLSVRLLSHESDVHALIAELLESVPVPEYQ
ncbi:MAG: MoxR family ATPase [Planctomycetota bacterium]